MTLPSRLGAGAVDLGALKEEIDARKKEQASRAAGQVERIPAFFSITPENFEHDVVRRSLQIPVIVMLGAGSVPESEQLRQDLEDLATQANLSYVVAYADVEKTPEFAQVFRVQAIPTVLVLAGGQPVTDFAGPQPKEAVQRWLEAVSSQIGPSLEGLPEGTVMAGSEEEAGESEDPRLIKAVELIDAADYAGAIALYDEILATDPKNTEVIQARDQARLLERLGQAGGKGDDLVAQSDADPTDLDKQYAAADQLISSGHVEEAFDRLIAVMKTLSGEEKEQVKDRILELFTTVGNTEPQVLAARQKLASALF